MTVTDNELHDHVCDKESVTQDVTDNETVLYRYDKESVTGKYGPKYHIALEAYKLADYCGKCFKIIHKDDDVAIDKVATTMGGSPSWGHCMTVICPDCLNLKRTIISSCLVCGRNIHYRIGQDGTRRFHTGKEFCSLKCKWTYRNQQTAKNRLEIVNPSVACEVCSTEFTPSRTDSRYCSNKCRQKAYRQRKSD